VAPVVPDTPTWTWVSSPVAPRDTVAPSKIKAEGPSICVVPSETNEMDIGY